MDLEVPAWEKTLLTLKGLNQFSNLCETVDLSVKSDFLILWRISLKANTCGLNGLTLEEKIALGR